MKKAVTAIIIVGALVVTATALAGGGWKTISVASDQTEGYPSVDAYGYVIDATAFRATVRSNYAPVYLLLHQNCWRGTSSILRDRKLVMRKTKKVYIFRPIMDNATCLAQVSTRFVEGPEKMKRVAIRLDAKGGKITRWP